MKRTISILVLLVMSIAGCTGSDDPPTTSASTCDPDLAAAFDAWERAGFSGSIAILDRDGFVCRAGYGWADRANRTPNTADTVFSIGSISKAVTAAAILDLVDAGRLRLGDRAGDLVPGIDGPAERVTVRQLLQHTSGLTGSLADDHRPLGHAAAIRAVNRLDLAFEPGTDYAYTNAGYSLLALIINEVSGTTYRDYIASHTLRLPDGVAAGGFWDGEPAAPGPRAIGYLDDGSTGERGDFAGPHWALSGNGDLAMTMPLLAKWVLAHPPRKQDGRVPGWATLDASEYGEPVVAAAGGGGDIGHEAVVAWLPESGRIIAIASNTPTVTAEELMRTIAEDLIAGDPLPRPQATTGQPDPAELRAAAGRYRLAGGGSFVVAASDTALRISARGRDAVAALFAPTPENAGRHERGVMALLEGPTDQGHRERQALQAELGGPIDTIEPVGTILADGELRTYVVARSGPASTLAWYAVDPAGGVAAAAVDVAPPKLRFVPDANGRYRPDDPAGTGPDVVVAFDGSGLTLTGPSGSVRAVRTN